jgi:MoxR-like ATPase
MTKTQELFAAARRAFDAALIERTEEIDLTLTALVAGEHLLLVGPPGTAKSLLLESVMRWVGGKTFSALMTKFTTPEEVFGPVSIAGLKEDKFLRVTTGKLPEADGVFLDEIFKSSSAILNTLLRVLNERVFDRGDGAAAPVPLLLCVAASNEWPQSENGGKELGALFDRFVLRKTVKPIATADGRDKLLWADSLTPEVPAVKRAAVDFARKEAAALPWSDAARQATGDVLQALAKEGIRPGDRRQRKTVGVVRAFAWLSGADEVVPEHLEVAAHCLWDDPEEQPAKAAQTILKIANPAGMKAVSLLGEAEAIIAGCATRDLGKVTEAVGKLGEITEKLEELRGPRAEKALARVKEQKKRLHRAALDAVDK